VSFGFSGCAICPAVSLATSCYTGITGSATEGAGVLTWLGGLLGITATDLTPVAGAITAGGACVSATATCDAMLALDPSSVLTAAMCPLGQSVTIHVAAPLDEDPSLAGSCMGTVHILNTLGFRSVTACGTSDCNAPLTPIFVPSIATLIGYTVNTFLANQIAFFITAMALSLNVAESFVVVSGVTASASASASSGRHLLQAGGVDVGFTVQSTVGTAAALHAALATPLPASAFTSAGLPAVTAVTVAPQAAASVAAAPPVSAATLAANAVAPPAPVPVPAGPAANTAAAAPAPSAAPARCALAAALLAPALLAALA
jgi:hypothetical protein